MPFQLPVNTSLVRGLTLSLSFDQLQKIHFKAVTFPSLQISYTPRLAGSASREREHILILGRVSVFIIAPCEIYMWRIGLKKKKVANLVR